MAPVPPVPPRALAAHHALGSDGPTPELHSVENGRSVILLATFRMVDECLAYLYPPNAIAKSIREAIVARSTKKKKSENGKKANQR